MSTIAGPRRAGARLRSRWIVVIGLVLVAVSTLLVVRSVGMRGPPAEVWARRKRGGLMLISAELHDARWSRNGEKVTGYSLHQVVDEIFVLRRDQDLGVSLLARWSEALFRQETVHLYIPDLSSLTHSTEWVRLRKVR